VIKTAKKPFHPFVGMSRLLLDVLRLGGVGCFDPVSNTLPEVITGIHEAFKAGDEGKAEELHEKLSEHSAITRPGGAAFMASRKEVMRLMGMPIESTVKGPIPQLTAEQKKQFKENVEKAGLLNAALEK
jgi:dihydrodipicolinate synthase/N-acetylneuraminate lyase